MMQLSNSHWAVLMLLVVSVFSCDTNKKLAETAVEENKVMDASDYLNDIVRHQVQADWLTGNARLSYDNGSMAVGAVASIKMEKNKAIWMSVKKFGFELARALVTPDSLFIIDRINNEYAAEPLSYIENRFKLPADLEILQQILLGNPVFFTQESAKALAQSEQLQWSAADNETQNDYWFALPGYQLGRMKMEQKATSRLLDIDLLKYGDAGANRDFSYLRKIALNSRETGRAEIEIEFTKVEIDVPTSINFSVPPRYKRMDN